MFGSIPLPMLITLFVLALILFGPHGYGGRRF